MHRIINFFIINHLLKVLWAVIVHHVTIVVGFHVEVVQFMLIQAKLVIMKLIHIAAVTFHILVVEIDKFVRVIVKLVKYGNNRHAKFIDLFESFRL